MVAKYGQTLLFIRGYKMKAYYSFVYLDDKIIESLYSQLFGDVIEKCSIKKDENSITTSIKSNILNMLKSTISGQEQTLTSEQEITVVSSSKKAQLLIEHIKSNKVSIQKIIADNQPYEESIYFVGRARFFISDIYDKKTGTSLFSNNLEDELDHINTDYVLVLESGNTDFINKISDHEKNSLYGIMMHMSNSKMKKNIRHLTWQVRRAKEINFCVLGELIKCSEKYYKISPFAVWC